jgi:hypothetical protein
VRAVLQLTSVNYLAGQLTLIKYVRLYAYCKQNRSKQVVQDPQNSSEGNLMSQLVRGLRVIGLLTLALCGLMAMLTAVAQANWLVEGVELKANETVAVSTHTEAKLAVPAKSLEFRCTTVASEGLKLLASSADAEGGVKFSGCTAFQISTGTVQKNCKPKEPIVAGLQVLPFLHNGLVYWLYHAPAGKPFTTIELPELCALMETSPITGSLVAECLTSALAPTSCSASEATHLVRPASGPLFPSDVIHVGASAATLEGVTAVKLSGANVGRKWASDS